MAESNELPLDTETAAWCDRAGRFVEQPDDDPFACLALVREGIFLRRQWDLLGPDAPVRRRLLTLLAAAQNICQKKLAAAVHQQTDAQSRRVEHVLGRLAEDDAYLAGLLADQQSPAESIAFAVECFRDDMHWLGTLVALLDGSCGIDFTGRVLLEQESLQRTIETRDQEDRKPGATSTIPDELRVSAERLRRAALARQVESLLAQPEPEDLGAWFDAWQAAGRLVMRLEGASAAELENRAQAYRGRAIACWKECLGELPQQQRKEEISRVAGEMADTAAEALTFLEDLSMPEAVQSLEILSEDASICLRAADALHVSRRNDRQFARLRGSLRRRRKAVAAELQERRLGWRLERIFGHRAVVLLEQSILLLLVVFMVMLIVEGPMLAYEKAHWPGSKVIEATFAWADLAICMVFLTEFSLKLFLSRPRLLYFRRTWITGLVPAIPLGFIAYAAHNLDVAKAADYFVLLRGLRYLRLPQMVRWLRLARPLVRFGRVVVFMMQASDRMIRRIAPLVNRNLVLFERAAINVQPPEYQAKLAGLRERFFYRATELIATLPRQARQRLVRLRIEDLTAVLSAPRVGEETPMAKTSLSITREIPLEQIIARLLAATPAGISERIGRTLAQSVARWCRAFDVVLIRRLPVIRDLVAAGHRSSPYGTTAQVANRIGALLQGLLEKVYWVADFYGTVTAPQLVDSVGDWMIKGTARPARRFLMLGAAFLALWYLTSMLPFEPLEALTRSLRSLIGMPLIVLGVLCLVPLLVGLWFRQIAGEATDFCSRVAEAQFISATKLLKQRFAERYHAVLHSRVIAPELEVTQSADGPNRAAVELLFQDYLDAPPLHCSDTRTTTQLLGNLTLVSLRETRLGYGRRQQKRLRKLDLTVARAHVRGPYLWFHFISRSLAQQTAKLMVDYNSHALPLDRAATAGEDEIHGYVEWLSGRLRTPVERLELPEQFERRRREISRDNDDPAGVKNERCRRGFQGNDFTAICFLSADPEVEDDVRRRYGRQVAELMHRDRCDNIRRVFRTYPFHRRPKGRRTVNPLALHARYIAGGRVLLLPFRMALWGVVLTFRSLRLLARFVRDVLNPTVGNLETITEADPYPVAVRKIHRMRKPVFLECLRMRAQFDPEYLGVLLPGCPSPDRQVTSTPVEEDLQLVDADPGLKQQFRELAGRRRQQMSGFRRLLDELGESRFSAESLRAMAIAYTIDYRRARSRLEAVDRLRHALDEAALSGPQPWRRSLRTVCCKWRIVGKVTRLWRQPAFAATGPRQRRLLVELICRRRGPLLAAVCEMARGGGSADLEADARETLLAVACDPATWSRQLVVLRAVQTLSVLDLKTYHELVYELGEYDR